MLNLAVAESSVLHKVLQERRAMCPSEIFWLNRDIIIMIECKTYYTSISYRKNGTEYQVVLGMYNGKTTFCICHSPSLELWRIELNGKGHVPENRLDVPDYVRSEESFFQYSLCADVQDMTGEEFMHCYNFCKTFNTNYPYVAK